MVNTFCWINSTFTLPKYHEEIKVPGMPGIGIVTVIFTTITVFSLIVSAETIQGRKLFKGGNYLRKDGKFFFCPNIFPYEIFHFAKIKNPEIFISSSKTPLLE